MTELSFKQFAMFVHFIKILTVLRPRGPINFVFFALLCNVCSIHKFNSQWNIVKPVKSDKTYKISFLFEGKLIYSSSKCKLLPFPKTSK